jgi:hypothetical protein
MHFEQHCFATREACEVAAEDVRLSSQKYPNARCRYDDGKLGKAIRYMMQKDYAPVSRPIRIADSSYDGGASCGSCSGV